MPAFGSLVVILEYLEETHPNANCLKAIVKQIVFLQGFEDWSDRPREFLPTSAK